jgi:hypothetical protein
MTKPLTPEQRIARASGKVATKPKVTKKAPLPKSPIPNPEPKKRAIQTTLPGTIEAKDEELTELALVYVDVRDRRMELTRSEKKAQKDLHDAMKEKRKDRYHDPEARILVEIVQQEEKVKVHHGNEPDLDEVEE